MASKYTKAQAKATRKYLDKFERVYLHVEPELKRRIEDYCKDNNMSMKTFAVEAFERMLEQ